MERPDSRLAARYLTTWKFDARCHDQTPAWAEREATARIRQPLMVRLQTPRFLVVGIEPPFSSGAQWTVRGWRLVTLEVLSESVRLDEGRSEGSDPRSRKVRVDWSDVRVDQPGTVRLQASARSRYADAMVVDLVAHEHGLVQRLVASGQGKASSLELSESARAAQGREHRAGVQVTLGHGSARCCYTSSTTPTDAPADPEPLCASHDRASYSEDLGVRAEDVAARLWVGSIQSRWRRPIVQDMWDGMKWMR